MFGAFLLLKLWLSSSEAWPLCERVPYFGVWCKRHPSGWTNADMGLRKYAPLSQQIGSKRLFWKLWKETKQKSDPFAFCRCAFDCACARGCSCALFIFSLYSLTLYHAIVQWQVNPREDQENGDISRNNRPERHVPNQAISRMLLHVNAAQF